MTENNHPIFAVSAAGMDVQRARVETATLNLANAHSAHAPGRPGYVPQRVVVQAFSVTNGAFAAAMRQEAGALPSQAMVPNFRLEPSGTGPRQVHDPGHPLADARGFVSYPSVDPAQEMMTLLDATRAYEANVVALNTSRELALKALDIGGN